jgi:dihydrofolate reductase
MGKLIYLITTSLDGYVADEHGNFDFTEPSEEVLAFINDRLRNVGTFLFGRKLYETMAVWDTIAPDGPSKGTNEFLHIWRQARKVVYSNSLTQVKTANTTLERTFDPAGIPAFLKSDKDANIGGPHLAAVAIHANMIDEYHQFIAPVMIGSGNPWLPPHAKTQLELVGVNKFANGVAHLHLRKGNR